MSTRARLARPPRSRSAWLVVLLALGWSSTVVAQIPIDSNTFGGMRARAIGPAVMSGRIAAIDAVPTQPPIIYVGSASGGVWKSDDGGVAFEAIFDEYTQSIGAVRVDPSNHDTVWVGTGESWVRNSVSVGDGVYRSTDAGDSWQHMGLADTERIAELLVDPSDSDTVFVCATGHAWNANEERGVFKSSDGGDNWEKVLYVDADTGCGDLAIDPQDPQVLYAGMWQFRRYPDYFTSGGPGSGLYRSTDGGATWTRQSEGLPEGDLGRIAIAVAPSRPNVVYANVEAEETALYRSNDLGATWSRINASDNVQFRPFYFGELVVDPHDFERVYRPAFTLSLSTDGGKSFSAMLGSGFSIAVHPDHHALWVHPDNPNQVLLGTDGGLYVSEDRAANWRHVKTLPVSQFYRVSHDLQWPYNVYGGLQDNGSWMGPSRSPGGIENKDWDNIGGGDGFWSFADPNDPNILYTEYQGGMLSRVNKDLSTSKSIRPYPEAGQPDLRFNWNTPIHLSPNDPETIYYGSQFLHRSRNRGDTWETISPDLTTNDPQRQRQATSGGLTLDNSTAENNTTIYSISESPKDANVIWVGTDDGYVQVTRDGGATWTNVVDNMPDVPEGTWVSTVHASPHAAATAFVTLDGHRTGDMAVRVLRTDDHGASWRSIATDQIEGYAWVIRQDWENPDLLFLGTELGLFVTLDGGQNWARFKENLPRVAVHDLSVHPTEHDLIIGTHGRGVYIIDDISPLRSITAETLESNVALLSSRAAVMEMGGSQFGFGGGDEFVGENPGATAGINYFLRKRHLFGDLKAEVFDADGNLITTLPGQKRKGLNRIEWPMFLKPPKLPASTSLVMAFTGPRVPEGTYTVKLTKGKEVLEGQVQLVPDPRTPYPEADRKLQQATALDLYHRLADLTYVAETVTALQTQVEARADDEKAGKKLRAQLIEFGDALGVIGGGLASTSRGGMLSGDERLREKLGNLYGDIARYDGRPTDSQLSRAEILSGELDATETRFESLVAERLDGLNQSLERRGLEALTVASREEWEAEDGAAPGSAKALRHVLPRLGLTLDTLLRAY